MEQETDGVLQVGEVPVIVRRASPVEADHSEARRGGRDSAFRETLAFIDRAEATAPPYTDTRPWAALRIFLNDQIQANV